MSTLRLACVATVILALAGAGCGGTPPRAPVTERGAAEARPAPAKPAAKEADWRPKSYTVKKGDTLYGIALEYGLDYRELAAWNYIDNPSRIRIGQSLRLAPPEESVVVTPAGPPGGVEVRPLGTTPAPAEAPRSLPDTPRPLPEAPRVEGLKTGPKALKLPYSEHNLALIQGGAAQQAAKPEAPRPEAPAAPPPAVAKPEPARPEAPASPPPAAAAEESGDEEVVTFAWPTQGKVLTPFSEATKGVDIAGRAGQPILASAAGKVVYSGSGLRGYGKLIIIKHNKTYLSAYAHNDQLLVKEGQTVTKGQKIAEMGSTDADRVKLHFEIRRYGKPVDPLKHLPSLS